MIRDFQPSKNALFFQNSFYVCFGKQNDDNFWKNEKETKTFRANTSLSLDIYNFTLYNPFLFVGKGFSYRK